MRIDKFMVEKKMVLTRSQASMLIKQGDVFCNGKQVKKPGLDVSDADEIEIRTGKLYVSRGAYKLIRALDEFEMDVKDKVVADCGASTGGFTQVCLERGASKVYAIDVGHDQLHELVKNDPRVINMEGVNLKDKLELPEKVDLAVADISFISLRLVFPTIASLLKENAKAIVLVKPQFEAGKERLGKGGIVSEAHQEEILDEVRTWFKENNYKINKLIESPIKGKTGNTEYLALIEIN